MIFPRAPVISKDRGNVVGGMGKVEKLELESDPGLEHFYLLVKLYGDARMSKLPVFEKKILDYNSLSN